jgi:predicted RNA binding protein YcfA (HicA-like mRNA interferase family)
MPMTSREMIRHLKDNGFRIVSQNGSHVKMKNDATGRQTEVPYHSTDLKRGLEQAILKQAGLK